MIDLKPMHDAVLNGYSRTAKNIAERALAAGVEPLETRAEIHDADHGRGKAAFRM